MNPYAPYEDLPALLRAAAVPVEDLALWTTSELLRKAAERRGEVPQPKAQALPPPRAADPELQPPSRAQRSAPGTKVAVSIRSLRLPAELEVAVDEKARRQGTTLNAIAVQALRAYVG